MDGWEAAKTFIESFGLDHREVTGFRCDANARLICFLTLNGPKVFSLDSRKLQKV